MKLTKKAGSTSEIWQIWLADTSSTTGAGLTGLVFNSASLTAYYHRDTDTTATVISLQTMTVGTFTTSGFKEIDSTNMPGWYQFCPPNAAIAAGAKSCAFYLKGATNMAPLAIEVQLTAIDVDSATAFMTSVASVTGSVGSVTGAVGSVTGSVGSVTGAVGSVTGNVGGSVASVTARVTANTDQLAGQTVSAAAGVTFPSSVASPTNITAGIITTTTNVTNDVGITQVGADKVWLTAARSLTDKVGFALSATGIQAIWDALTAALTTVGSIGKLLVDNINATISSRSTYAGADTGGTTTLLSRLTGTRATNLDNLDATISSRSTYAGGAVASVTAQVDANVKQINGTVVNGNGSLATPWGP